MARAAWMCRSRRRCDWRSAAATRRDSEVGAKLKRQVRWQVRRQVRCRVHSQRWRCRRRPRGSAQRAAAGPKPECCQEGRRRMNVLTSRRHSVVAEGGSATDCRPDRSRLNSHTRPHRRSQQRNESHLAARGSQEHSLLMVTRTSACAASRCAQSQNWAVASVKYLAGVKLSSYGSADSEWRCTSCFGAPC
jgi:hypothetical protein